MKYAPDDPAFADFVNALDPVNATAEESPGFVWRMISTEANSESLQSFEASGWLVNMSVWLSLEDLKKFVSSTLHRSIMRRRVEWFDEIDEAYLCLWWVARGHRPDFNEAMERLDYLRAHGPSEKAFNFARPFDPP